MKIAFIVNSFPKLSESFIVNQITGLLDLGHDVEIFANFNPRESEVHSDVLLYSLEKRTHYNHIPQIKTLCRMKAFCQIVKSFITHPIRMSKTLKYLFFRHQGFSYKLLNYALHFLGKNYDIIHAHFGPAGNIGAFLKKTGVKSKLVTTFHGYDITKYIKEMGPNVYNELFQAGDSFTYNSEDTKKKVLSLGCPQDRMVKVPMGLHLDRILFAERKIGPDNKISVLSVGRLVEMKGREYAIEAMAGIVKKHPNVCYNIVGDGLLRDSLNRLVEKLDVVEAIHLLGWVSSEKLKELYEQSHIFLHPSVTASNGNMEGQGVVLLEAQAYGLPVVATKHSAFPETVLDGRSGFLVPERDAKALEEKLEYLIKNPDIWPEIGKCGRKYVEQYYDIDSLNRKLENIYIKLLET